MGDTFICDNCGGEFPSGDEDKALAEMRRDFGDLPPEERAVICDECYKLVCPNSSSETQESGERR